jgi:hypothetical protein
VTALELLLWAAIFWTVFLAYCASDLPAWCALAAHHLADRAHGGTR